MFTGLIETVGRIAGLTPTAGGLKLHVGADAEKVDMAIGDSIAINGVCLTVTRAGSGRFTVTAVPETLDRSNLGALAVGDPVNLERALQIGQRLGGHFVQGHVDGTAAIKSLAPVGDMHWLVLSLPGELMRYVIMKGAIAVDGISLTVAEKTSETVAVAIIPHTMSHTILAHKQAGDMVNIEVDMMAKYAENFLAPAPETGRGINRDLLKEHGFS